MMTEGIPEEEAIQILEEVAKEKNSSLYAKFVITYKLL
jgi:hypothetical protein